MLRFARLGDLRLIARQGEGSRHRTFIRRRERQISDGRGRRRPDGDRQRPDIGNAAGASRREGQHVRAVITGGGRVGQGRAADRRAAMRGRVNDVDRR